jgi:hypothetical protein
MIALIILLSFTAIGIGVVVHAIINDSFIKEHDDSNFESN